jgi:superfamily II DNA or RNA helicase
MENSKQVFALLDKVLESYSHYNPFFNFLIPETRGNPIEPFLHQVEVASRLLFRKPIRVLIADEIGLGKTITALALLRKLTKLGRVKRALILLPRILINQWITELRRIGIERSIHRIERHTIRNLVARGFPEGYYIASMDLVKRDEPPYRYFSKIEQVPWDLIIIDEAHRLGIGTERLEKIGKLIGKPDVNVLMLTATPHRGIPEDYLARLTILDPYLVKGGHLNNREFYSLTHNVIVFRRRKEEVNKIYEKREIFPPCDFNALIVQATEEEEKFQQRLMGFLRTKILDYYEKIQEPPKAIGLLTTVIFKRATSSPYAAMRTLENVIKKRAVILTSTTQEEVEARLSKRVRSLADSIFGFGFEDYDEEDLGLEPDEPLNKFAEECSVFLSDKDMEELTILYNLAKKTQEKDSRLNAVLEYVKHHASQGSKIVLFSEFKDTVNYIHEALIDGLGPEAVVKLTSDESGREDELRRIRRKFEKDPRCMVLIASDVASEGLNLQVANILINYEITWSPVKLEQRVGRVWRLGQTKKVDVYTVLLTAEIDKDALNIVYRKLLELDKATKARPIIGEYVLVLDMREKTDTSRLPLVEFSKGKRKLKATEYELIATYVRGGKEALSELIDKILITLKNLNDELRRISVFPQVDPNLLDVLVARTTGFKGLPDLEDRLKELLDTIIPLAKSHSKISYIKRPKEVIVIVESGAPQTIKKHYEFYAVLNGILQRLPKEEAGIPCIVAYGKEIEDMYIAEAQVLHNNEPIYTEPLGILIKGEEEKNVEILRGAQLIKYILNALSNLATVPNEHTATDIPNTVKIKTKGVVEDLLRYVSSNYLRYIQEPCEKGWRDLDRDWLPKLELMQVKVDKLFGVIRKTKNRTEAPRTTLTRRKITEKQAMKAAIEYEKAHGRKPVDVSEHEHYDIRSTDPKTNEVRYIEVKGHEGREFAVELTEAEYKEAAKRKKTYWLYLVYNIWKEIPEMLAIRDPLSNMKLKIVTQRRYLLTV